MAAYEANQSESWKRNRPLQFDEIDEAVYQWYSLAWQRQVPVTGHMLQEEALKIAEALGNEVFKPSQYKFKYKIRKNITHTHNQLFIVQMYNTFQQKTLIYNTQGMSMQSVTKRYFTVMIQHASFEGKAIACSGRKRSF